MTPRTGGSELIVFGREPRPGQVKTRLIPALGWQGAARLYRALLEQTLDVGRQVGVDRYSLWLDVDSPESAIRRLAESLGFAVRAQSGETLGERMAYAFADALPTPGRAVLIGSDCPGYSTDYLERAFTELDQHDAVLGPATDGGYVLIGIRQPDASVFNDIDWSTDRVIEQTRSRLRGLGWRWSELTALRDIDEPQDLRHLQANLKDLIESR
jgi:hypothetical protein